MTDAIAFETQAPDLLQHLAGVHVRLDEYPLDKRLIELVYLRVSQINGCDHCIDMHIKAGQQEGETAERQMKLVAWRHSELFTEQEQLALDWAEALTHIGPESQHSDKRAKLRTVFSEQALAALTVNIAMINLWNRLYVSGY